MTNLLSVFRLIQRMSVPSLYGTLTINFRDGKVSDLLKVEMPVCPGADDQVEVTIQKKDGEAEIQKIMEAIFADYRSR